VGHLYVTNAGTRRSNGSLLPDRNEKTEEWDIKSISSLGQRKVDIERINYRPFASTIMFEATKELNYTVESTHIEKRTFCLNRDGSPAGSRSTKQGDLCNDHFARFSHEQTKEHSFTNFPGHCTPTPGFN
jgi:hypothetical protein